MQHEVQRMLHIRTIGPHSHADAAQADEQADVWRRLWGEVAFFGYLTSPGISLNDSLAEACCKVLRYRFDWSGGDDAWRIFAREDATPQRVRKLRVTVRRMRNDLRLFESGLRAKAVRPVGKGLRALSSVLRRVRTLDASLANLGDYYARCDEEARAGLTPLLESWQTDRLQASQILVAFMASDEYADYRESLDALFIGKTGKRSLAREPGEPSHVRHIAQSTVWQHLAGVRAFDTLPDTPSIEHLHRLRIAIKRLRYTTEALCDVLPAEQYETLAPVCIRAQDAYGAIHDAHEAAMRAFHYVSHQSASVDGEQDAPRQLHQPRELREPRVALRGIVTYAEAQQKVVEARLIHWRDLMHPFL